MIKRWLILISGYRQDYAEQTGMDRLFDKVHDCGWRVEYWPWNADWQDNAAYMHRHCNGKTEIAIAAYSWGAGYGALKLAESLQALGRRVNLMVLCDPVYRRPWVPTWFNLLPTSMASGRTIKYPPTVNHIQWFYQREDKPAGHRPIGGRIVSAGMQLQFPHTGMDDAAEFHNTVIQAVSTPTAH